MVPRASARRRSGFAFSLFFGSRVSPGFYLSGVPFQFFQGVGEVVSLPLWGSSPHFDVASLLSACGFLDMSLEARLVLLIFREVQTHYELNPLLMTPGHIEVARNAMAGKVDPKRPANSARSDLTL